MEGQNNTVQEQTKKSPIVLIILVVILMLGCLIGSYYLNGSGELNEGDIKQEEGNGIAEKEESIEVESGLVKKLERNITTAAAPYYGGFYELFTNRKMTSNDIGDEIQGKVIALRLYDKTNPGNYSNWKGTTYTKAEVGELVKAVFGSNVSFKHKSIGACPVISYDATTETYIVGGSECGGTVGPYHSRHKVVKAVKRGDELILSIRVVFGDGNKFYSNYEKTIEVQEDKDEFNNTTISDFSKGSLYEAVFKLENDNYGLSYVEPVKD